MQCRNRLRVIFATQRAQRQQFQHRQIVRLPLMQFAQQQFCHPQLAAIAGPHQYAGVIECGQRIARRQLMGAGKGADRRLAIVEQQGNTSQQLPASKIVRLIL